MRPHPNRLKLALSAVVWCVLVMVGVTWQGGSVVAGSGEQTVTLKVEGITCGSCVKDVRAALQKLPGVKTVDIKVGTKWGLLNDYADTKALVTFDPGQTGVEALVKAIESASTALSTYRARVLPG
ncbi:MAG: heavy-metal-associated domain-containing protein [Nitrospira sp.]|nr:heavy-metal-associated domain-containing protein [Nitrospira sp.]